MPLGQVNIANFVDGPVDTVYEFFLFFFLMARPDARYRSYGQLDAREREAALRQTRYAATQWKYPVRLVVESRDGPAVMRWEVQLHQEGELTAVNVKSSLNPENAFGRLLTWRARRHMRRMDGVAGSLYHHFLLRIKQGFETRKQTGMEEAFEAFRSRIRDGRT